MSPGLGLDKILLFLRRPAPSGGTLRNWALSLPERWWGKDRVGGKCWKGKKLPGQSLLEKVSYKKSCKHSTHQQLRTFILIWIKSYAHTKAHKCNTPSHAITAAEPPAKWVPWMRNTVGSPSWCGDFPLAKHPFSAFIVLMILRSGWMILGKLFNLSVPQFPHLANDSNNSACLIKLFWRSKEIMCRNLECSWLHHKLWKWMSKFPNMSLICPEWWEMQFYPSLHNAPSSWWSQDARLCSKRLPESKFRWDPLRPATPSSPFLRRWVRGSELTQLFQDKPTQTQGWMFHTYINSCNLLITAYI